MSDLSPTNLSRRPDWAALVIALVLGTIAATIIYQTSQMRLPPNAARVGPTVFPYVVAAGLALLAVGTVVSALRGSFPERERDNVGPVVWIVGGLVGQMLLMGVAGFSIGTGVLFACTAAGFGKRKLWISFPIGLVFSLLIWIIFARGLQLALPIGPLERLIP